MTTTKDISNVLSDAEVSANHSKAWVVCNLPYSKAPEPIYPDKPDLDPEERAIWGRTLKEVSSELDFDLIESMWGVADHCMDAQGVSEGDPEFGLNRKREFKRLLRERDPKQANLYSLRESIQEWQANHPVLKAYLQTVRALSSSQDALTFRGQGLANPGVQIELSTGDRYLIGHINPNRGVCDDCTEFNGDAVVARYRVLITPETLSEG